MLRINVKFGVEDENLRAVGIYVVRNKMAPTQSMQSKCRWSMRSQEQRKNRGDWETPKK